MTTQDSNSLDGSIKYVIWGDLGRIALKTDINADGVLDPGLYYAEYTWDENTQTLNLSTPTQTVIKKPKTPTTPPPPDIKTLNIQNWSSSDLRSNLAWTGPTSGALVVVFIPNGQVSGPIGTVMGP
jgi:hypothetical protein